MEYLIENVILADPETDRPRPGRLCVRDGRFADPDSAPPDIPRVDGRGLTAAPGIVDMHVHVRDPGQTHKEDVFTAARAAAFGGVTSLLAMPNTSPPADSPEILAALRQKAAHAPVRLLPAACISRGLSGDTLTDFDALKAAGAAALSDDGRPVPEAALMGQALVRAAKAGLPVLAHSEDLGLAAGGILHEGAVSRALGVRGIPAAAEDVGVARDLALCESLEVPVHICHVSTAVSLRMIRDAKRRGVPVTCETAPHYFALTHECLRARDANFRMNPPLRTEEDRRAVLEGILDGTVDVIATDHAPHTEAEKRDFEKAPNGILGLQTLLPLCLMHLVHPGHLTVNRLFALLARVPARILGREFGTLRPGAPADFVLFDPGEKWIFRREEVRSKSFNSPFLNRELRGKVKLTVLSGRATYRDLAFDGGKGGPACLSID